jgi:hypothetical protein
MYSAPSARILVRNRPRLVRNRSRGSGFQISFLDKASILLMPGCFHLATGWRLWADSVCCYNIEGSNAIDAEFLPCPSTEVTRLLVKTMYFS